MRDWPNYLQGRANSELFGFLLLDYYYQLKRNSHQGTPAAFIRKVVTDYADQTSEPVTFHKALLAACVQLLGDDFTEIISVTKLFIRKHGKTLSADKLEQIADHYDDYSKAPLVRAQLLRTDGRPGGYGHSAGKKGNPAGRSVMVRTRNCKAFISYSHESDEHKTWVRDLAARLRSDGVESILDKWATAPGDQLPRFMEASVRQSDVVLIVCTPKYKARSDGRKGGIGYEGDVMTAEMFTKKFKKNSERKFIPLLRGPEWRKSAPSWLSGKRYIDLRGEPYDEQRYRELLDTLLGRRETAPPVQTPP